MLQNNTAALALASALLGHIMATEPYAMEKNHENKLEGIAPPTLHLKCAGLTKEVHFYFIRRDLDLDIRTATI